MSAHIRTQRRASVCAGEPFFGAPRRSEYFNAGIECTTQNRSKTVKSYFLAAIVAFTLSGISGCTHTQSVYCKTNIANHEMGRKF